MKMKFITAIVAFSITFGFSALLTEYFGASNQLHFHSAGNNQTGMEISSLLQEDIANGDQADEIIQAGVSFREYSQAVGEYVNDSEGIEDVNLPPDFRFAWHMHMKAWRRHADFLESYTYLNNPSQNKRFSSSYKEQRNQIKKTWFNVLNIGKKYGAIIPKNAY